jgi:hypothetical protein
MQQREMKTDIQNRNGLENRRNFGGPDNLKKAEERDGSPRARRKPRNSAKAHNKANSWNRGTTNTSMK